MVPHHEELAITLGFDEDTQQALVEACMPLVADTMQEDIAVAYISLCDAASPNFESLFPAPACWTDNASATIPHRVPYVVFESAKPPTAIFAGKKYIPVALKIWPMRTKLPQQIPDNLRN